MLGKYQLIAEIARGGMGVVYLAMVQGPGGFNKLVVVKELKPELVEEPAFLMMFLDEARLAARLNHPNIVQTNEVGNHGDRYFMAMDYLDGRGLDHVRRRSKTAGFGLSVPMQLRVLCDVLAGLDYAHKLTDFDGTPLHIVHRDVSPQNVFLTFDGQVKLLDFGIAKASDSMHETHAGVVKGKVSYMSPEQGRGQKVDARADVFSVGVLLWEALTGKRMREGKNDQEKLWALVSEDIPRASSIRPSVPPQLDEICARAMAWNRDERYSTAGAMQRDIERYLTQTGTNVSAREVGACVSELFREDRANTNAVIEAHVARARGGIAREQLPVIDVASRTASASGSASGSSGGTPSSQRALTSPPPEPALETSLDIPSARSVGVVAAQSEPRVVERPRNTRGLVLSGAAVAAVVAGVVFFMARSSHEAGVAAHLGSDTRPSPPPPTAPPPAPAPAPAAVARSVEPPPVAKPALVDVEIRVSPENAKVSIDGKEVDGNPFSGQYVSDDVVHHIRASAPGYIAKSRAVVFNTNVTLDLSLERTEPPQPAAPPARPAGRGAPARPAAAPRAAETARPEPARPEPPPRPAAEPAAPEPKPSSTPDIDPAGGRKPNRPIDPNNPYGGAP
ncbi:MAG TPA: serine/threonine-protein kinase [Kofleriaceae bacterium]|nr:serine/threonine-protein kinase [Kofleriaceae bacterium]